MEQHGPKISLAEIVIITPYLLIIDLIGIALFSVGLDDYGLLDIIRFPITQLYLRMKGVKGNIDLIGNIVKLIPYVGVIPFTFFWFATIYLDRHPKVAKIADVTGKIMKKKAEGTARDKEAENMMTPEEMKASQERSESY